MSAVDSAGNVSPPTTGRTVKTLATGALLVARGPYLSNVTGTSAVVSWWTNLATSGVVSWGLATPTEHSLSDPAGTVQHHSVTITGLSPSATYEYRIGDGASLSSDASFATAATPGQSFTFAAIGDFGGGGPGETQNANNIAVAGTAFVQTVGDNIYPSAGLPDPDFNTIYSDFDQRLYRPFASVINRQAYFPANGNKEYYGNGEFWANFPMLGANHSYYSYDWGDAHILVLDSEQPMTPASPQYQFAQTDLAAHQASAWRIVAIQRPPYSSSSANSSSVLVRTNLVPLFQQQNVSLVLSGNSHNYERSLPLINDVPTTNGITYIVTGAGGNGFNSFTLPQPTWSAFREATIYEYARVTVSPTSLVVDAIRADTATVLDTTIIHAAGPSKPPAPTNLTATPGNAQVSLSWTASTGATGYNVKRGTATGGPYTTVSPLNLSATTFTDTGLTNGTAYFYVVTATNSAGESSNSNQATATPTGSQSTSITLVNQTNAIATAPVTSVAITIPATTAGDTLVVVTSLFTGATRSVGAIIDSSGATWNCGEKLASATSGSNGRVEIWWRENVPGRRDQRHPQPAVRPGSHHQMGRESPGTERRQIRGCPRRFQRCRQLSRHHPDHRADRAGCRQRRVRPRRHRDQWHHLRAHASSRLIDAFLGLGDAHRRGHGHE